MTRPVVDGGFVADTIYTQTLARAAESQGSTQALASLLRVPENTLLRWMSGRAQMPLQAFLKLVDMLSAQERADLAASREAQRGKPPGAARLTFKMGPLFARCARCDGTEFVAVDPAAPLLLTSDLACAACGLQVRHGTLICQLAKDAVHQSRAMTAARARQQVERQRNSAKARAVNPDDSKT
jgi:hypothetical protein